MKPHITSVASIWLGLLVTGCPLTDHYQLLEDEPAGLGNSGGGGADAGELGGQPNLPPGGAGNGGQTAGCIPSCSTGRTCRANRCEGGWIGMAPPPSTLVARSKAASVAVGNSVFIWGGLDNNGAALGNGAIYSPTTDKWTALPTDPGSPSPRIMATAVWTGDGSNKVIVYGGTDAGGGMVFRDGSVYDLTNNSWSPLPANPSTSKRSAPFGYWDGSRAVFFGGLGAMSAVVPGADRFDLKTWSSSTNNGDPGLLGSPAIAFDGTVMYLQGGVIGGTRQDKVYAYTSSTDTWASLNKRLSVRAGAFGAWDGAHFVVWGGQDDQGLRDDGKMMSGMNWSEMSPSDVLSARRISLRRSGWAFQIKPGIVAMLGGQTSINGTSGTLATDGATYAVDSAGWTPIPSWSSQETHEYGIGVWTGEEFVIWGGRDQNVSTLTGERWAP